MASAACAARAIVWGCWHGAACASVLWYGAACGIACAIAIDYNGADRAIACAIACGIYYNGDIYAHWVAFEPTKKHERCGVVASKCHREAQNEKKIRLMSKRLRQSSLERLVTTMLRLIQMDPQPMLLLRMVRFASGLVLLRRVRFASALLRASILRMAHTFHPLTTLCAFALESYTQI